MTVVTPKMREEALSRQAAGESVRQIARGLGVSPSTIYWYLSPSYQERQRQKSVDWRRRQRGVCERCGGETHFSGRTGAVASICASCARAERGRGLRGQGATVGAALAYLADGKTRRYSEIRDELGVSSVRMGTMLHNQLLRYGFVERVGRGRYVITDAGRAAA